jgi:hypothetical protein
MSAMDSRLPEQQVYYPFNPSKSLYHRIQFLIDDPLEWRSSADEEKLLAQLQARPATSSRRSDTDALRLTSIFQPLSHNRRGRR